jgi:integrase
VSYVKDLWFTKTKPKRKTARHPDKGGSKTAKRWLAVWHDPSGREQSKAFRIQDAAMQHARKMEEDVARGEYIDPIAGKALFGPLAAKWIRLRDVGDGSRDRYERTNRLHVEPTFGHRQVKSPQPSDVLEWLRNLGETHGYSIQQAAFIIVCGTFDLAVADGLRKDNPARSPIVPRPRNVPRERDAWPAVQVTRVIDAHPEPYRAIPTVSAGCGLREAEAFALAEDDFDFDAGRLLLRRQISRVRGRWYFKAPKRGKERTAPLSPGVARVIQAHIQAYPPRPYTLPWMPESKRPAGEEHTCRLLFRWHGDDPRTHDQHIRPDAYDQGVWKPALVMAGVIPEPERGPRGGAGRYQVSADDGTHALRHYYVTTLLDNGVSLAAVMDFAGHSKRGAPVTLGVYGHTTEDSFAAARAAIDRSLFPLRAVQDHQSDGTGTERAGSA